MATFAKAKAKLQRRAAAAIRESYADRRKKTRAKLMRAINQSIKASVVAAMCGASVTKETIAAKKKLDQAINEVMAITGSVGDD
jgi:hypothetical protein